MFSNWKLYEQHIFEAGVCFRCFNVPVVYFGLIILFCFGCLDCWCPVYLQRHLYLFLHFFVSVLRLAILVVINLPFQKNTGNIWIITAFLGNMRFFKAFLCNSTMYAYNVRKTREINISDITISWDLYKGPL